MKRTLSLDSTVVTARGQVSTDLVREKAILNFQTGQYYGLNRVGAFIWDFIQQPKTVHEICKAISDEYEVAPEQLESDLTALLHDLASEGLIEIGNKKAA